MMITFYLSYVITYIIGGLTMLPMLFLIILLLLKKDNGQPIRKPNSTIAQAEEEEENRKKHEGRFYKVGWLQVYRQSQRSIRGASIGGLVKSYLSSSQRANTRLFAVLKFNTLYLYDSELQLDCKHVIHVTDYSVHIYPYHLKDHELYSRPNEIQLKSKKIQDYYYYVNCSRCIDKEDWYFALLNASKWTPDTTLPINSTRFDQDAMNHLLSTVHSNQSHFETQWLNALLGRLFLGIYKKQSTRDFFYNKVLSKINKLNARRPDFLDEITVRSVDGGHGAPFITDPRLIQLRPLGEYTAEFQLYYEGHFRVELETVLRWKYSDRLPAIRIDLVLAITLQSIQGKMMLKIKEPPTNRCWLGFYTKPKMEWLIEPVMWEKRIGFAVVSKAIKTKIEEIITETMVLPNMDDMVFSPAGGVGGIFGEEDDYGRAFLYDDSNDKKPRGKDEEVEEEVIMVKGKEERKKAKSKKKQPQFENKQQPQEEEAETILNEEAIIERKKVEEIVAVVEKNKSSNNSNNSNNNNNNSNDTKKKKESESFDTIPLYANVTDSIVTAEPMPLFTLPTNDDYQKMNNKKKKWFNRRQQQQQQQQERMMKQTDENASAFLLSTSSESDSPSQRSLKSVMNSKRQRSTISEITTATTISSSSITARKKLVEIPSSASIKPSLSAPMQRLRSKSLPSTEITEISVEHTSSPLK